MTVREKKRMPGGDTWNWVVPVKGADGLTVLMDLKRDINCAEAIGNTD